METQKQITSLSDEPVLAITLIDRPCSLFIDPRTGVIFVDEGTCDGRVNGVMFSPPSNPTFVVDQNLAGEPVLVLACAETRHDVGRFGDRAPLAAWATRANNFVEAKKPRGDLPITPILPYGEAPARPNRAAEWFGRVLWLGILVNLSFAIPALFFPGVLTASLGLGGLSHEAGIWMRDAGMLLVLLCGFYALVAPDPIFAVAFARWSVAARFVAAGFWLWLILGVGLSDVLWICFATDFTIGLVLLFFIMRMLAVSPPPVPRTWRRSLVDRLYGGFFSWLERRLGVKWYNLWPSLLGSIATGGLRREMRAKNLHASPHDVPDSGQNRVCDDPTLEPHPLGTWDPAYREGRSPDGSYNDLSDPAMGMNAMQFGRNFPPAETYPTVPPGGGPPLKPDGTPDTESPVRYPNPRDISNLLLARPEENGTPRMIRATSLNLLAAAWIQFQNHGWFNHRIPKMALDAKGNLVPVHPQTGQPIPFDEATDFIHIDLESGDPWIALTGQKQMRIHRTIPDPTRPGTAPYPPTYRTTEVHWWSASQIYAPRVEQQRRLRTFADGMLKVVVENLSTGPEVMLPLDPEATVRPLGGIAGTQPGNKELGVDLTGFNDNYWVGTSLLHTLFVREHNYLCGELKKRYAPNLAGLTEAQRDEWYFSKARLIVAALMAKIHTVEWTPAILNHPVIHIDLPANWWGVLGRWFKIHIGRVSSNEGISGIIGSQAEHQAAPYSLTEDFVAVYRLHPLIPDVVDLFDLGNPTKVGEAQFMDIQGSAARTAVRGRGMTNWLYSFARQCPGAVTLRNYPKCLRQLMRITGERLDLATRDIVRDRERGIPRYNKFRELLRMRPMRSFEELVGPRDDPAERTYLIQTLKKLYGEDGIDRLDLMVGLFAEKVPSGFGFSDTAFRIFILMASRRLKSDRFFTDDFRPEVYTPFGIDWVNNETMASMLLRHYSALGDRIPDGWQVFAPWPR